MISPVDFKVADFTANLSPQMAASLTMEDLHGSELIDNLILLKFVDPADIQSILRTKYSLPFTMLKIDPTPEDLRQFADKYKVLLQRNRDTLVCYLPLGLQLDNAALEVDIPNYRIRYIYIPDSDYNLIKTGLSSDTISRRIADFRPLLVFRRLVIDCLMRGGTDLHMQSRYVNKLPAHFIFYRIKREMTASNFHIDYDMMQRVVKDAVGKLSTASAADIDSQYGVTTQIPDLFKDGTTDVRFQCIRNNAGLMAECAIQSITTTNMKVDELGFPKSDVELIRTISKRRTGLTLVTGEMRSGKNTTIMAMVNEIKDDPINIVEYSNPVEVRMSHSQLDYRGDIDLLLNHMKMAKKFDIDIAILNEIPNSEVAFAVRDLVNSAIGVTTTTHIDRLWHAPNKLNEFFEKDYKTIISQLNAIINHKMFRRWSGPDLVKRMLSPEQGDFEKFAYKAGVRQYFVPKDASKMKYSLQPLVEILVITDEMKTAMLNYDELWRAEQMLRSHLERAHATIENKLAEYINSGLCSLDEMRLIY